ASMSMSGTSGYERPCSTPAGMWPAGRSGLEPRVAGWRGRSVLGAVHTQGSSMDLDPIAPARRALVEQVLRGPGEAPPEVRAAAAAGAGLPPELASLVEKIHRHAYQV